MTMTFEEMQALIERTLILTERNSESITRLEDSLAETRAETARGLASLVQRHNLILG
ncbi:hypothetical protein TUMEXPCC7403_24845 [Tumidithrix helvetica PCC 7403]